MAKFLKVMSDPTRLEIITFLKDNPSSSNDIQVALGLSQSYTSHQLKKLYDADLIEYDKKGKIKVYRPKNMSIYKLLALIQSYVFELEKEKLEKFNLIEKPESIINFSDIS